MTGKELRVLLVLAALNFTNIMDFMIMMPLQEYLVPDLHISPADFSLLVAVYAFTAGISSLTASFFVDRFDRKHVLLTAYAGFLIGTFVCGLAQSFNILLIARSLTGMFGGLIGAQVISIVGDLFPYERRGRAMGILMTAFALASVFGVPAGLFLAQWQGWSAPFLIIASLGCIVYPFVAWQIPSVVPKIDHDRGFFTLYRDIAASKNQKLALLLMFTLTVSHFLIIPFIAPYLELNVGFTRDQIALMYMVGGVTSLIGSPLIGRLADQIGKHVTLRIFILLSMIPVLLITHMPPTKYYIVLMATALFFLFAGGRNIPAQAIITAVVSPAWRGGFMNLTYSVQQLATGAASLIAGAIVIKNNSGMLDNYTWVGYTSVIISLLAYWITRKVNTQESRSDSN